jgi:hypothetical protein
MMPTARFCPRCKAPRPWRKVRRPGARASIRECLLCGYATKPIKPSRTKMGQLTGALNRRAARKKLEDQADELWRRLIYRKAVEGRCALCNKLRPLQAAHNISRGCHRTRWLVENGAPLCAGCHQLTGRDHAEHVRFFRSYLGDQVFDRLQFIRESRGKNPDLKLTIILLEQETIRANLT